MGRLANGLVCRVRRQLLQIRGALNDGFGVSGGRCLVLGDPGPDGLLGLARPSNRCVEGVVEIHAVVGVANLITHAAKHPVEIVGPMHHVALRAVASALRAGGSRTTGRLLAQSPGGCSIDAQEALRETSDDLLSDLDALSELEDEKRRTPHGDPRLVDLAARVEEIAARVLAGSRRQLTLSQSVSDQAISGIGDPTATITGTPRSLADILADWRAAERVARSAEAGSLEADDARARAERLRQEYRDGFDHARGPDGR